MLAKTRVVVLDKLNHTWTHSASPRAQHDTKRCRRFSLPVACIDNNQPFALRLARRWLARFLGPIHVFYPFRYCPTLPQSDTLPAASATEPILNGLVLMVTHETPVESNWSRLGRASVAF